MVSCCRHGEIYTKMWVCWKCGFEPRRRHGCVSCSVLSGRGLCDGPITSPEKTYWVCVCVFIQYDDATITLYTRGSQRVCREISGLCREKRYWESANT